MQQGHLENNNIDNGSNYGMEAIANSEILKNITDLNLDLNMIEDEGAIELANSVNAKNIQKLDLNNNGIKEEGILALANSKNLGSLISLNLDVSKYGVNEECRKVLVEWKKRIENKAL